MGDREEWRVRVRDIRADGATWWRWCKYTAMKFCIEKCAMLRVKSEKKESAEGTELQNQYYIWTLGEKEDYSYLGILEADIINQAEMKETRKSTSKEKENLSKPRSAVLLLRYSERFFKIVVKSGRKRQQETDSCINSREDTVVSFRAYWVERFFPLSR